jgi:hypothetical protein
MALRVAPACVGQLTLRVGVVVLAFVVLAFVVLGWVIGCVIAVECVVVFE